MSDQRVFKRFQEPGGAPRMVPLVVLVLCGECGNAEAGWVWMEPNGPWWSSVPTTKWLPGNKDEPRTRAIIDAAIAGTRARGKRYRPPTNRSSHALTKAGHLTVTCPKHGPVVTVEPIDPASLDKSETRRVRARRIAGSLTPN